MHRLDLLFIINPQNLIQIRTNLETVNVKFINSYFFFHFLHLHIIFFAHRFLHYSTEGYIKRSCHRE